MAPGHRVDTGPTHIKDLTPDPKNRRAHNPRNIGMLVDSLQKVGASRSIVVDENGVILAGNGVIEAASEAGLTKLQIVDADGETIVAVRRRGLTEDQKRELAIYDNRVAELATWNVEQLKEDAANGLDLAPFFFADELKALLSDGTVKPGLTDPNTVPDQRATDIQPGDIFELGPHRLLCGDSTDSDDISRLMGGQTAVLCYADPPYGMGKVNEGIANDNLYAEKLDAFQMSWWRACRRGLVNNGAAYIWGTAEDLWRLWYLGGLRESERLTLRNEIVWDKGHGQGMDSEQHRMFPTASERCLFFMLGEQGFNNNADNYWHGWDAIVDYLRAEKEKTGWDIATFKRLAGHSETSGCHWFDKSQWMFPTKGVYESWQRAAREHDAFKREHDDLKREFYETRAYFDNTHSNMTDVWTFQRVNGEDRHGHAAPKPVEMVTRAVLSSAPEGSAILAPFGGTGPEVIACEQSLRRAFICELKPSYCQIIIDRWENFVGNGARAKKVGELVRK